MDISRDALEKAVFVATTLQKNLIREQVKESGFLHSLVSCYIAASTAEKVSKCDKSVEVREENHAIVVKGIKKQDYEDFMRIAELIVLFCQTFAEDIFNTNVESVLKGVKN